MNVVVVDQKGPKVQGYFALATEVRSSPLLLCHIRGELRLGDIPTPAAAISELQEHLPKA